ncbi:hypothetical protein LSTR_LSTR006377 [Laodelphax striatellus]|uniref:Uncharacterized protein n=1 Tax=Laodelphax striatellus TaxID=195883 RepID=A0A482XDG4_LAOST|nr:hypothetical protein LSTR_LSTR006377 [Laodelphax striatellus]
MFTRRQPAGGQGTENKLWQLPNGILASVFSRKKSSSFMSCRLGSWEKSRCSSCRPGQRSERQRQQREDQRNNERSQVIFAWLCDCSVLACRACAVHCLLPSRAPRYSRPSFHCTPLAYITAVGPSFVHSCCLPACCHILVNAIPMRRC